MQIKKVGNSFYEYIKIKKPLKQEYISNDSFRANQLTRPVLDNAQSPPQLAAPSSSCQVQEKKTKRRGRSDSCAATAEIEEKHFT